MKRYIATLLLLIGLSSLTTTESDSYDHLLMAEPTQALLQSDSAGHASKTPSHSDCHDAANTCGHPCHFGHCALVLVTSLKPGNPPIRKKGYKFFTSFKRSPFSLGLLRPPIA